MKISLRLEVHVTRRLKPAAVEEQHEHRDLDTLVEHRGTPTYVGFVPEHQIDRAASVVTA